MSTIKRLPTSYLAGGGALTDTKTLEAFWQNPSAVLDLTYGPDRQISGACPPHDHDEDGGESLLPPILLHSFGTYIQNLQKLGVPIGPPVSGSFAKVESNGITDRTNAKRLFCCGVTIPGGVASLRVDLVTYNEAAAGTMEVGLVVCLRPLAAVNYKLGAASNEVITELNYEADSASQTINRTVNITDLTELGDPALDREVEFSLWLASDLNAITENRICDIAVWPLSLTAEARDARPGDNVLPKIQPREIKAGIGILNGQLASKIKELYNGLNRAVWGMTPGLLNNGKPDRRRRYREPVDRCHQHQGIVVPTEVGGIFSDGAVLKDTQSFGYVRYLEETLPLVANTPPTMGPAPNRGAALHLEYLLANGWARFEFRRSIPAGVGALVMRLGIHPGITFGDQSFDASSKLLVSISVTAVDGTGSDIVTRMRCGAYSSTLDPASSEYGYIQVEPIDDVSYLPNSTLISANKEAWNQAVEITEAEKDAMGLLEISYRISAPIVVQLTYPPANPGEAYRRTQDYNVKIRCKLINSAGECNEDAGMLWIKCENAPGY